jgi:hypothetical protein
MIHVRVELVFPVTRGTTHPLLNLDFAIQNTPISRTVEPGNKGQVISIPKVGGLHHRYKRAA